MISFVALSPSEILLLIPSLISIKPESLMVSIFLVSSSLVTSIKLLVTSLSYFLKSGFYILALPNLIKESMTAPSPRSILLANILPSLPLITKALFLVITS
jgi:hypothetical protein